VSHIDTEWSLTSISQLQYGRTVAPEQLGGGDVRGIVSVDISDWTAAGSDGQTAMESSREEVAWETWRQLKRSVNVEEEQLRDEDLITWFLDPDIYPTPPPGHSKRGRCS
jgi:hypothetical protein